MEVRQFITNKVVYPSDRDLIVARGAFENDRIPQEYTLFIDSSARDTSISPSPFHFYVEFNTIGGSTSMNIPMNPQEVNYLFVRQVALPLTIFDSTNVNSRYMVLRIKEMDSIMQHYSNPILNGKTDVLLFAAGATQDTLYLEAKNPVTFRENNRLRLRRLTFQILDGDGTPIVPVETLDSSWKTNVFIDIRLGVNDKQTLSSTK